MAIANYLTRLETARITFRDYARKHGDTVSDDATIMDLLQYFQSTIGVTTTYAIELKDGWRTKIQSNSQFSESKLTEYVATTFDDSAWLDRTMPYDEVLRQSFSSKTDRYNSWRPRQNTINRKKLPITESMINQRILLYFDGTYATSNIYVNGQLVKTHVNGYTSYWVDVTDYIDFANLDNNILAVNTVDNLEGYSRWYNGDGIYRPCYLITTNDIAIEPNGIVVTTPNIAEEYNSDVSTNILVSINNHRTTDVNITLKNTIYFNDVAVKSCCKDIVLSSGVNTNEVEILVNKPTLWGIYQGNVYTVKTEIIENNTNIGTVNTNFGYRWITYDKDGFYLNGEKFKFKGVCLQQDLGALGMEQTESALRYRFNIMKEMGVNAFRTSHRPESKLYIQLCDEMGIMVFEEHFDEWGGGYQKTGNSYGRYYFADYWEENLTDAIMRDINSPSVVMWGVGNEIFCTSGYNKNTDVEYWTNLAQSIYDKTRELDTTRPISMSGDNVKDERELACFEIMDVVGVNYGDSSEYTYLRNQFPDKCIYGSETTCAFSTKYEYENDSAKRTKSSYDDAALNSNMFAGDTVKHHEESDYLGGMFVWTGFDYMGATSPYKSYPSIKSLTGVCDSAGFPKDIYYMYKSVWNTEENTCHILPRWNHADGDSVNVWVYSNGVKVELYLNGTLIGTQTEKADKENFVFENVAYADGRLVANAYNSSNELIAQDVLYTHSEPSKIDLKADKTKVKNGDYIFATVSVLDEFDHLCMLTRNIKVEVENGTLIAFDNGLNTDTAKFIGVDEFLTNKGQLLAIVRADDVNKVKITAICEELNSTKTLDILVGDTEYYKEVKTFIDATEAFVYSGVSDYKDKIMSEPISYSFTLTDTTAKDNLLEYANSNVFIPLGTKLNVKGTANFKCRKYSDSILTPSIVCKDMNYYQTIFNESFAFSADSDDVIEKTIDVDVEIVLNWSNIYVGDNILYTSMKYIKVDLIEVNLEVKVIE